MTGGAAMSAIQNPAAASGGSSLTVTLPDFPLRATGTVNNHSFYPTADVSGGVGPYTYAWSQFLEQNGTWTITGATTATPTFAVTGAASGETATTSAALTVTDSTGAQAYVEGAIFYTVETGG